MIRRMFRLEDYRDIDEWKRRTRESGYSGSGGPGVPWMVVERGRPVRLLDQGDPEVGRGPPAHACSTAPPRGRAAGAPGRDGGGGPRRRRRAAAPRAPGAHAGRDPHVRFRPGVVLMAAITDRPITRVADPRHPRRAAAARPRRRRVPRPAARPLQRRHLQGADPAPGERAARRPRPAAAAAAGRGAQAPPPAAGAAGEGRRERAADDHAGAAQADRDAGRRDRLARAGGYERWLGKFMSLDRVSTAAQAGARHRGAQGDASPPG